MISSKNIYMSKAIQTEKILYTHSYVCMYISTHILISHMYINVTKFTKRHKFETEKEVLYGRILKGN